MPAVKPRLVLCQGEWHATHRTQPGIYWLLGSGRTPVEAYAKFAHSQIKRLERLIPQWKYTPAVSA